jgi:DNA mismatch repair ATPase MutS
VNRAGLTPSLTNVTSGAQDSARARLQSLVRQIELVNLLRTTTSRLLKRVDLIQNEFEDIEQVEAEVARECAKTIDEATDRLSSVAEQLREKGRGQLDRPPRGEAPVGDRPRAGLWGCSIRPSK